MNHKRFVAALLAVCVVVAPAAFAATAGTSSETSTTAQQQQQSADSPKARAAAKRRALHRLAHRRHLRLFKRADRLGVRKLRRSYLVRADGRRLEALQRSNVRLRQEIRAERRERRMFRRAGRLVPLSTLRSIAMCESHHDPRAVGGGGRYRGLFQMTFHIWSAVGGKGDPAGAPVREQYYRAALVYHRYGSGQWPVCGR